MAQNEGPVLRPWSVLAAAALLAAVLALLVFFSATDTGKLFEAPLLLAWLNTVFLCAAPLCLAALAARSFYLTGSVSAQLMGCGLFSFGLSSLLAGWAMPLFAQGPNPTVTMHNAGAFVSGALHLAACGFLVKEFNLGTGRRYSKLAASLPYIALALFFLGLAALAVTGGLPAFFIPGHGPSLLRQVVLGCALFFFAVSGAFFLLTHYTARTNFALWYGFALLLIAEGLGCVLLQRSVGGAIGWLGRFAQYAACVYFVLAFVQGLREGPLAAGSFWPYLERNIKEWTSAIEQKRLELSEQKKRLESIIDGTRAGTWEWNVQTGEVKFNERWAEMLGYTLAELGNVDADTWGKFGHPDDLRRSLELMNRHLSGESGQYECEARMKHKDGSWIWVMARGRIASRTEDGRPLLLLGTQIDITVHKLAEEKVRGSEEKYRKLFELESDAVMLVDAQTGKILDANKTAVSLYGYTLAELLTMRNVDLSAEPDETGKHNTLTFPSGVVLIPLRYHRKKGGAVFPVEINASAVEINGRKVFIPAIRDISSRKQAEQEKEKLVAALAEQKKEMENFLYITTHDLRTPLLNIQGYTQALSKDFDTLLAAAKPEASASGIPAALSIIAESAQKMNQIINALLKVSRQGRVAMDPAVQDANALFKSVLNDLQYQLEEAGCVMHATNLPPCTTDAGALSHIFNNLVANAVKYRDKSRQLKITVKGEAKEDGKVTYSVADNGLGIAAADLPRIWQLFYSGAVEGVTKGEGIGLTMVKRMAEANGGRIWAESKEGEGSTFFVEMPA